MPCNAFLVAKDKLYYLAIKNAREGVQAKGECKMSLNKAIGYRLIELMLKNNRMTALELAKRSGVSNECISRLLNEKTNVKVDTVQLLCKGLNITLADFFNCKYFREVT